VGNKGEYMNKACNKCKKGFVTYNDSENCYDCTLERVTGGNPPEEGDFNTAAILSGKMSDEEHRELMRELRNVELGISSSFEPLEPTEEPEWDDQWCRWCLNITCTCDEIEDDDE